MTSKQMITLKNLGEATPIQVFNQAKEHLLKQMKKSESGGYDRFYMYRGLGGLKCAAGCFIADDEYDPDMEDIAWIEVLNKLDGKFPDIRKHAFLISQLQGIHDDYTPDQWETRLGWLEQELLDGRYDQ